MRPSTRRILYRHFVIFSVEFIATSFLLIYCCMGTNDKALSTTHAALASAFAVMALVSCFGHLTGCHMNPCVTTAFVILGLTKPLTALVYIVAEFLGAIFGFYLVLVMTQDFLLTNVTDPDSAFCMTTIVSPMSVKHGFLCEFLATSLLIFIVCSVTDRRNSVWGDSVAIKIGFVVGVLVFGAGPYTGASMNPARSFAPALLYMKWKHHWVYWASTFSAAICTSVLYKSLFSVRAEDEVIIHIAQPTTADKPKQSVDKPKQSADKPKQSVLVVDVDMPKIGTARIESSQVSPRLKTEIAVQQDATFTSNS